MFPNQYSSKYAIFEAKSHMHKYYINAEYMLDVMPDPSPLFTSNLFQKQITFLYAHNFLVQTLERTKTWSCDSMTVSFHKWEV